MAALTDNATGYRLIPSWVLGVLIGGAVLYLSLGLLAVFKLSRCLAKQRKLLNPKNLTSEEKHRYRACLRVDIDRWDSFRFYSGALLLLPFRITFFISTLSFTVFTVRLLEKFLGTVSNIMTWPAPIRRYVVFAFQWTARCMLFGFGILRVKNYTVLANGEIIPMKHTPKFSRNPQDWIPASPSQAPKAYCPNIVANHTSLCDVMYFVYMIMPSFISKDSVRYLPLIGCVAQTLLTLFVKREDSTDRMRSVQEIKTHQQYTMDHPNFPPFVIFPEGTTFNGMSVCKFRRGAFESLCALTPVVVHYTFTHYNGVYDVMDELLYIILLLSDWGRNVEAFWLPSVNPESLKEKHADLVKDEKVMKCFNAISDNENVSLYSHLVRVEMAKVLHRSHCLQGYFPDDTHIVDWDGALQHNRECLKLLKSRVGSKKNVKGELDESPVPRDDDKVSTDAS